jgi:hypothetical protein
LYGFSEVIAEVQQAAYQAESFYKIADIIYTSTDTILVFSTNTVQI